MNYLQNSYRLFLLTILSAFLTGCIAVAAGGVATSAAVANDRRTTGTVIEDQSIELKASQSLRNDQEINDNSHINITSYNLVVLVSGEVANAEIKDRIIKIVRETPKVAHVYDEIAIIPNSTLASRSSDTFITSKVKTKLLTLENFDGTRVKVVTERGVVYLMGLLTRAESDKVTEAARQVGGVQKVVKLFQYIE